jgi:hypothetical protein
MDIDIDKLNAGRHISFSFDAPVSYEFIRGAWNKAEIIETKPSYKCTGIEGHKYRKKTYAPKLKRLMR